MSQPRILKLGILADTKDLVDGLKKADDATRTAGDRIGDAFKKVGIAVAAAGAAVGAFAIKLGKDSIKAAIEAEAQQNRLRQILLTTGAATEKQVTALNKQAQALEKVGVVSAGNITVAQAQLATFDLQASTIEKLTPAILDYVTAEKGATASAEDLKSMTNGLAQALQGNFGSLTRTGFVLDENTKNMIKNGTETERAAALVEVLNSTYKGFNETLAETTEGQLVRLRNQFDSIKERIGMVLLPIFNQFISVIASKVIPVIETLVARFEKDAVPAMDKIKTVVVGFVIPALQNLWSFIKDYLVPIFRNIFKPAIEIIIVGFNFLAQVIKDNREGFQVFLGVAERVWSFIRDQLAPILGTALVAALKIVFDIIGALIDSFLKFFEIIGKVARLIGIDLKLSIDKANTSVNNLNSGIVDAYKNFGEQSRTVKNEAIPAINSLSGSYDGMANSANNATKATKNLTAAKKELSALDKELAALQAGGAIPSAISKDLERFYRSELGLISEFGGKIEGINLNPTDPFFGFGQGSSVNKALQQRAGGSATATGGVTINVQGLVIDPEGAARAIEQLISDSNARGGPLIPLFGGP
jgi:hypothetical protein